MKNFILAYKKYYLFRNKIKYLSCNSVLHTLLNIKYILFLYILKLRNTINRFLVKSYINKYNTLKNRLYNVIVRQINSYIGNNNWMLNNNYYY